MGAPGGGRPAGWDTGTVPGPDRATAAIRRAVRETLTEAATGDLVLVACSGGADSMALAAAAAVEGRRAAVRAGAVVVDHALQAGSAAVATQAGDWLTGLGLDPVEIVRVGVPASGTGVEAAAREARYAALEAVADRLGARLVLLGHTLDDQAEQVLLGLARGSGARSLSGMPAARGRARRPLLGISHGQTRASLEAQGQPWWDDPMNEDPAFLRVRARRALADLERDLGPGVTAALARSADQLRADADLLDALADAALEALAPAGPLGPRRSGAPRRPASSWAGPRDVVGVDVERLRAIPPAVRTRVWRRLLVAAGAPAGQLSARHTDACDALLTHWRGQGPSHLPGGLLVRRTGPQVTITLAAPVEWTHTDHPTSTVSTDRQE